MHEKPHIPMIFLAGPPGSGKTTLGIKVCEELNLGFLDLSRPISLTSLPDTAAERKILEAAIKERSADVVALSWGLQQHAVVRTLARRSGVLLLLWAHPLDMQTRSGYSEPLFTPVGRLKTRGGFGRNGTGCREFRRLDRGSDETFILVDVPFEEAVEDLKEYIISIRQEPSEPPAAREGLMGWVKAWQEDFDANKKAAEIIVDAMARYTIYLKSQGASPRKMSGVYSDLNAAGILVMMYDAPKGRSAEKILHHFSFPPWNVEFKRKFSDSPNAIARYEKNLEGFSRFLQESGMLPKDAEE
jgi:hypothetical protein